MNIEEINVKIAEYIRTHREKQNWTIRNLERESGVSRETLSRIEGVKGFENLNPNLKTLKKILDVFDKNFVHLFEYVYSNEQENEQDKQ